MTNAETTLNEEPPVACGYCSSADFREDDDQKFDTPAFGHRHLHSGCRNEIVMAIRATMQVTMSESTVRDYHRLREALGVGPDVSFDHCITLVRQYVYYGKNPPARSPEREAGCETDDAVAPRLPVCDWTEQDAVRLARVLDLITTIRPSWDGQRTTVGVDDLRLLAREILRLRGTTEPPRISRRFQVSESTSELDELREARRLLAQEHHAKQMDRHGLGAPLCICVHCEAYREEKANV